MSGLLIMNKFQLFNESQLTKEMTYKHLYKNNYQLMFF